MKEKESQLNNNPLDLWTTYCKEIAIYMYMVPSEQIKNKHIGILWILLK